MQQSNIASSNATTSYNYGPPPPQQFSRAVQQQAGVSRSMASNQNMGISSSQQMSPPPVSRQYFSQVEVCITTLVLLVGCIRFCVVLLMLCLYQHTMMSRVSAGACAILASNAIITQLRREKINRTCLLRRLDGRKSWQSCHARMLRRCFCPGAAWAEAKWLSDLQERPVTKEVVTYVQERHPVAKQVCLHMAVKHPPTLLA